MPLKLEHSLQGEARQKGYRKGTKRYDRYVYGTMNKLGLMSHNHAGNLGPDRLLRGKGDYEPTFKNVRGIHIGVVTVIILLVVWYLVMGKGTTWSYKGVNGDGASVYLNTASYSGWKAYQYNALGATSGALNGESN